jgi:hypothetical protein
MKIIISTKLFALLFSLALSLSTSKSMKKGPTPNDYKKKIKSMVHSTMNYTEFHSKLNSILATSDKVAFKKAIKLLVDDNKVESVTKLILVTELRPTQDEIGMNESLKYPLEDKASAEKYLKCGKDGVTVKQEIITAGGKFIIDGHHRWSQVYALNPLCKIKAIDLVNLSEPIAALKAAQLAIAVDSDKLPVSVANGVNLLDSRVKEVDVKTQIINLIKDDVLEVFNKVKGLKTKVAVADFIWGNILKMRTSNNHVEGAPNRSLMPQTNNNTVTNVMNVDKISKN